ncbi:phospholipid carrier-dependent glycosyltransferase [bacterium]|nr:phospholipid carrier-dependent glycosyltransferase [bacterium]
MRRTFSLIVLGFLLLVAAGLRIYHLDYKSLSIDETIGTYYAMEPVPRIFIMTINDVHPPLFYLIHHFWIRVFGQTESALRSISILFALASLIVLYKVTQRLFSSSAALFSVLLLAISPWHIWVSQNARSNSMLLFLVLLSTYCFIRLLQTPAKRWFIFYGIVTLAALLTHYFAFMIWISQSIFVAGMSATLRKPESGWWQTQFAVGLGYTIWLPFMISQFLTKTRPMYKTFSIRFIETLFNYLNPYAAVASTTLFAIGVAMMIVLSGYGLYRIRRFYFNGAAIGPIKIMRNESTVLTLGFMLAILANVFMALYFDLSRTLPILLHHLLINAPTIYANSVKPYHLEQLHSLRTSFLLAAAINAIGLIGQRILSKYHFTRIALSADTRQPSYFHYFAVMMVAPLLLAGLFSLKSPYLLLRNMVILLPFYIMILAFAVTQLKLVPRLVIASSICLLGMLSYAHFERWYCKDDWRSVALTLHNNLGSNEVVLLDHLFAKKPLYYYGIESHRPLRRSELPKFLHELKGDLWILRSYQNDWCVVDSIDKYLIPDGEWSFQGSTNPDDLFPIEGLIKLYHFRLGTNPSFSIPPIASSPQAQSLCPISLSNSDSTVTMRMIAPKIKRN